MRTRGMESPLKREGLYFFSKYFHGLQILYFQGLNAFLPFVFTLLSFDKWVP